MYFGQNGPWIELSNFFVLISARRLIVLYISAKFRDIILNGIKVMERTQMINR